ncbi:MAG: glycosyltransferase family 4 protein [Vicinamibacterales bacterium]
MRIAQISPLFERVPPVSYGGTERVVAYLTDELIRRGHDVTLFAAGDARTSARLVAACGRSLRTDPDSRDPLAPHVLQVQQVISLAPTFDIIHFHTGYLHYPIARRLGVPHLTTLHGRLDVADLRGLFTEYADVPVISISDAQRAPFPKLNWQATIPHGLPSDLLRPGAGRGDYLVFLGRISPEKGPARAIEIARRSGRRLLIAAKVDRVDQEYYDTAIKPSIDGRDIVYLGEVGDAEKQTLLGDAHALLFPIDWPEPFGIVVIEAMACGTPIIAWPRGSVPEIVEHGRTGLIVRSVDEAVQAVDHAGALSRPGIRRAFEERFTVEHMGERHLALYSSLVRRGAVRAEAFA